MKVWRLKLVATVFSFIIGVACVWVSELLFASAFSRSQKSEVLIANTTLTGEHVANLVFEDLETNSEQLPTNHTDLGVFDPSGDYHPLERPIGESERFIQFDLRVERKKGRLMASGEVRGVQPWYSFRSVSITEKMLKFSTVRIGGVNFDFDGEFLGTGDFSNPAQRGNVLLKGTLRKFVDGRKVMDINTQFKHYPGC